MFKITTIEFECDKKELLKRMEENKVIVGASDLNGDYGQRAVWKNLDNLDHLKLVISSNEMQDPEINTPVIFNNSGPGGIIQINPKRLKRFKIWSVVVVFFMMMMTVAGTHDSDDFLAANFSMLVILLFAVIIFRFLTLLKEKRIKKAIERALTKN